jgi:hypothetical protein
LYASINSNIDKSLPVITEPVKYRNPSISSMQLNVTPHTCSTKGTIDDCIQ